MKYFKNAAGRLYAFEDEALEPPPPPVLPEGAPEWEPPPPPNWTAGLTPVTEQEAEDIRNTLTPEQQAIIAADAEQTADIEAARQFARLTALRGMKPAQVSTYIANRYPLPAANLADANAILAKLRDDVETLAVAVAILARRI